MRYHGLMDTRAYRAWKAMRRRCRDPRRHESYKNIQVCDRWSEFLSFYEDMGNPSDELTLDRKDNTKGYSPDNCRWVTWKEQSKNRRNVKLFLFDGEMLHISEIAERVGIKENTLRYRIYRGRSLEEAIAYAKG
jgi:hypothetical protein